MKKTSKFAILSFLFLLSNLLVVTIYAQNTAVQNSDFATINQQWVGQLQYLNYGDDKSIVAIPCSLKTDFTKGKVNSIIEFDELDKNGKKMINKAKFYLSKNGKYFMMDKEKWEIISTENTAKTIQIIATKKGEDNGRSAEMKITWLLEKGKSLSWKKDVRYEGTNNFFNRNNFTFSKK